MEFEAAEGHSLLTEGSTILKKMEARKQRLDALKSFLTGDLWKVSFLNVYCL